MTSSNPPLRPTYILADETTVRVPRDPSLLAQAERLAQGYHQYRAADAARLLRLGLGHLKQGKYAEAIAPLQQALQGYRHLGDQQRQAQILMTLSNLYYRVADYLWAADYGRQCLRLARDLNDQTLIQQVLGHLGNCYRHLGNRQRALEYMTQSLNLAKKMGDRPGEMRSLNNLAMIYRAKGLTRQAATLYEASLMLATTLGDRTTQLQILQNLGNTYFTLQEYRQAIDSYQQFLALGSNGKGAVDNHTTRRILTQITRASIALGDHNQAIVFLQQQLSLACSSGDTRGAASVLDHIKDCYRALSDRRLEAMRTDVLPSL